MDAMDSRARSEPKASSATSDRRPEVIQVPIRCGPEFEERIIRALGISMSRSGKKITKNDFILHLIEVGLEDAEKQA